jgi:pimeloyl-ACP methyl ester carboxylesterase
VHIRYRSTDGNTGKPTVVSGTVFIPGGRPPIGGWPVVAIGHGTTGVLNGCGPSSSVNFDGEATDIARLAGIGYAVTLADYQGLGTASSGIHPYLDSRTAGYNIIDSVRALRNSFQHISYRWAAIGGSQGGGAVWSANEQAHRYAPGLDLVGTIAVAPTADVAPLMNEAVAGTLTNDQLGAYQWLLVSLNRLHPSLDLNLYRSAKAARAWPTLSDCTVSNATQRDQALSRLSARDLRPLSIDAAKQVQSYLTAWALPQRELSAPLFVAYGGQDPFINPDWTTRSVALACRKGGNVARLYDPTGGHDVTDPVNLMPWLVQRFADKPAISQCPKGETKPPTT